MLKTEALQAMSEGKKVTHRLFGSDEWVTMDCGRIFFEDGVNCSQDEFFNKDRQDQQWSDGYSIFK